MGLLRLEVYETMMNEIKWAKSMAARVSKRRPSEVRISLLMNKLLCQMWLGKRFVSCLSLVFLVVGALTYEWALPIQAQGPSRGGYARQKNLRKVTVADSIRM